MYYNAYELYHHGILGQKWGVRRFQNRDGTYTNAGKRRRNEGADPSSSGASSGVGKKIAAGLGIAAAVGVSAAVLANPNARRYISNFAGKSAESLKTMAARNAPKVKAYMKEAGKKAVKSLGESAKAAGKEMTNAAIASIGAIAIAKVVSKIDTGNADLDEVLRNTSTAGLRSVIGSSSSSGAKSTNRGGPIDRAKGAEISQVVGPPKQKEIDRTGPEYQGLFKDAAGNNRDPETRSMIKSMASAGYGVDQINQYLGMLDRGEIKHGDIDAFRPRLSAYIGLAYTAGLLSV